MQSLCCAVIGQQTETCLTNICGIQLDVCFLFVSYSFTNQVDLASFLQVSYDLDADRRQPRCSESSCPSDNDPPLYAESNIPEAH